jgi:hypothetical protein
MLRIAVISFVLGILLVVPALSEDVYTWTDEKGVKHYGNQPPDDASDVQVVFKEESHDAVADQKRTEAENEEAAKLIKDLEREDAQEEAEARQKKIEAEQNREPTQEERVADEKRRLEKKIADLEAKPLDFFGSQKNKRVRVGYYRYRLETLMSDPEKYFSEPTQFEGNVKYE